MNGFVHVMWDWNGTLLDDAWLCLEVINSLLREHGLPELSPLRYSWVFGFPLDEYCRKLGFELDRAGYERLSDAFRTRYEKRRAECHLRSGAMDALERIAGLGIRQSVLSAYDQRLLLEVVERRNLTRYFDGVIGVNNPYGMGKVERGRQRIAALGCDPSSVLLVGDTLHDRDVAAAMGAEHALVPSGHQHPQRLVAGGGRVLPGLRQVADLAEHGCRDQLRQDAGSQTERGNGTG